MRTPMAPAMPCKTSKTCKHGETRGKTNDFKSKFACILEASESTRLRMEESLPNYHEDHTAGQGDSSLQHYTNLFLCLKPWKFPQQKAAVDKEWEKISAWNLTKVRSKKEVIDEARTSGAKVHFASLMDISHLVNAELEAKHQKYKGRVVLRGDIVKDDSGSYASIHFTGIISISKDSSKNRGYHIQTARVRRTSSGCSICLYPGKWRMLQNYWRFPNRNVQTFGFVYHDTNGLNHGPVWKTQSFLLSEIYMVHPLAGLLWERQFEKIYWRYGWEKVSNCTVEKKVVLICECVDDIKLAGKKQNMDPMWKVLNKEVDFGEPTSFLDHVHLGCTQRQGEISKGGCWQLQNHVLNAGATEKLPCSENLCISSWCHDMEGHAKKCVGTILWFSKQDDPTTLQSINSMHWRPSFQRRRIEIRGRIVKTMLSNCSKMLVIGTYWTTRYSMVSEQTCTIDYVMDQSLWQTTESFDILHPSHMGKQTVLLCG